MASSSLCQHGHLHGSTLPAPRQLCPSTNTAQVLDGTANSQCQMVPSGWSPLLGFPSIYSVAKNGVAPPNFKDETLFHLFVPFSSYALKNKTKKTKQQKKATVPGLHQAPLLPMNARLGLWQSWERGWDFWQGAWEGKKSRLETFLQEVGAAGCHDVHPNDALTATYCRKMSSLRPEDNRTCQTDWGHESLWEDSPGARSQAGHAAQQGRALVFPGVGCGEPFPVLRGCLQVEKRQSPFWANSAPAAS